MRNLFLDKQTHNSRKLCKYLFLMDMWLNTLKYFSLNRDCIKVWLFFKNQVKEKQVCWIKEDKCFNLWLSSLILKLTQLLGKKYWFKLPKLLMIFLIWELLSWELKDFPAILKSIILVNLERELWAITKK